MLSNLFISFLNLLISVVELKTLLNELFISCLNLFISLLKEHMGNFKIGKITYSSVVYNNVLTLAKISPIAFLRMLPQFQEEYIKLTQRGKMKVKAAAVVRI